MGKLITNAEKEVLVEIVRFTQKQRLEGAEGGWKDFLTCHDKKFGAGLSDPVKRSRDILIAFLKTFPQDVRKYFDKMVRRHNDRNAIEQYIKEFPDLESPEQRLVHLTMEHPHYIQYYSFPSHNEGWKVMPLGKISEAMNTKAMVSVDCEMVLCQDGTEAVVRICIVDRDLEVKLDKLVNPNKAVSDYRTHITGVSAKDLEGVTCSLADVQKSLRKLLSNGTILIGHSLFNDLLALKFDHLRVIDTSYIFKYKDLPPGASPSLNNLCKSVLGFSVREEGEPHNCLNDAHAAMKLVLAKLEQGFDDPIEVARNVPKSDLAKLLLHKIPVDVSCQELLNIFPEESNVDIKADIRVRGERYSTFVVFKNAMAAEEAFRVLDGKESQDSTGRPQKQVFLKLCSGRTTSFYIRKMAADIPLKESSKKRSAQAINNGSEVQQAHDGADNMKRQKTCLHPCDHVKEIEKLKQELRQREDEIYRLQKILAALSRKHGL
ncbi:small RNA degrading nuclease 1-like [Typha angustifolia]|uniref:small RNA degrading nuclease 1-like n=1 Tax=Typha angustifolia TaxID=59011 RepID=UPI003C2FF441